MEFRNVLALRGPNLWAWFPVIEAWVDLQEWKDSPSDSIPGFNDRLMAWLPSLIEHRCGIGERGGFFQRLRSGTYLAHILEHVTLELQALAGVEAAYGRARETTAEGVYKVVFKYRDETLARACLEDARQLIMAAVHDTPYDVDATVARLRGIAEENLLGPSTDAIVQAARARNIPFRRLNEHSLVQLGYGSRQRRIRAAETDATASIAESIAQDKELTRKMLQAAGVPVAAGFPVADADDACQTAAYLGYPVVVKPQDGNQGRGVATNLTTHEQVRAAYAEARKISPAVLVEKYAPGDDYRLLVVGGKLVAAARRTPAHVAGDGRSTIQALVDAANTDPRRGERHANVLSKIHIDEIGLQVLSGQGFTPDSVPPAGERVLIRRNANLSTGGTATDVTDLVHPEVAARALEAAHAVGLDIAGIDVIANDIAQPMENQGAIVVEVNAAPGLRMHLAPSEGEPRAVGKAIVDLLFPPGDNGRIPVLAISGTNGKTTVTRFIAHLLAAPGRTVGMTTSDGIFLNDRRTACGDCSGPASAAMVLMNPLVDIAVLETARGGILRAGLAFNECHVAVMTNIEEGDHLGLRDLHTPEDIARLKSTVVEMVGKDGTAVLNAADPLVAGMAAKCAGQVLFFALDGSLPVIAAQRAAGGRALFVRDGSIILAGGDREDNLLRLDEVPLTRAGRVLFEVENTLAALGAALAMHLPLETLRERAATFTSDLEHVPSRFNVLEVNGATVVVDYAHNVPALRAVIQALDAFPGSRRVAVFSSAGDRRDQDIRAMGALLGAAFDRVILYEDTDLYGRSPGQIVALLREGLANSTRPREVEVVEGGLNALRHALATAQPGDLLLAQAHLANPTIEFLHIYLRGGQPDGVVPLFETVKKGTLLR